MSATLRGIGAGSGEGWMSERRPLDPRIRLVILRLRERVARAYEDAYRELETLGAWMPGDDPHPLLLEQLSAAPEEPVEGRRGTRTP